MHILPDLMSADTSHFPFSILNTYFSILNFQFSFSQSPSQRFCRYKKHPMYISYAVKKHFLSSKKMHYKFNNVRVCLISEFVYVSSVPDKRRLLSRPYKKSAFCLFLDCAFVNRSMNGFDSNFMVS